ncbi:DUF6531 domain-containing protein [Streptomyces sp. NPDC059037]|uniref:DUF6531 domain-containing protein n=1 Tax=Streptomyces sp. NPDC059037 TaxID=3346710 RepID=UPI0036746A1B
MGGHRPRDWHVLDLDKDPTPGDPDRVRSLAKNLHDFSDDVGRVLRDIKGMAGEDAILKWAGKTADAFTEQFEDAPAKLKKLKKSYEMAGDALSAYWPDLERAQTLADKALVKGREAQADLSSAKSKLTSANSWVERAGKEADKYKDDDGGSKGKDVPKPDPDKVKAATRNAASAEKAQSSAQGDVTSAQSALDAAKKMAEDARKMRQEAAGTAKRKIDEASDAGIQNRKWWEEIGDWVSDNWDTIIAVCKVVVAVVGVIAMIVGGPILAAIVIVAGAIVLADTLSKYAKGQATLMDVAFAALDCVPGMKGITTAAKLGKGLKGLKGGLKGLKSARSMLGRGKDAFGRSAKAVWKKLTDPVDLATGQMFLPQTDIELPGTLPLVFRRRLASDYRSGWWFGPTWSSTIDQRLEVDEEGVVFVSEDGLLLAYPHADGPGTAMLPEVGPRWPLVRLDHGGYRIDDPVTGQSRYFALPAEGLAPLERIADRNGNTIDFDYDSDGTPYAIRHSGGYHLKLVVEEEQVTDLILAGGAEDGSDVTIKQYGYSNGNLTEVINSSGLPLKFTYDERLRATSWTDTNHSRYDYTYDDQDRCTAEGGEAGHIALTLAYDGTDPDWPGCRVTTLTTAEGAVTRFVINERCQVVAEIDARGGITRTSYDSNHHVVSSTNQLGHTTTFVNNALGQPTQVTRPDGTVLRFAYDGLGAPTLVRLPDGAEWHREYDERGNCTSVTDPTGESTRSTYDTLGHLTEVTDALGHTRTVRCNAAGLPIELTDPLGNQRSYAYDPLGRVSSMSDQLGAVTHLWWTTEGQIARVLRPDGSQLAWTYDGEGNCIRHMDANGGVTTFEYTHFDLLSARTDPDGSRYEFAYDSSLRLTEVTNPLGLTWAYRYDAAGRLTSESDFDGRTLTYTHDAAHRLTSRTNALDQTVRFERDQLGQTIRKDAEGHVTTYEWDTAGQLIQAISPEAVLTLTRDHKGLITSEAVNGRTNRYAYDALGRRKSRTTPCGAATTWTYDAAGRLSELTAAGRTISFELDTAGRELSRRIGHELTLEHEFDEVGRLTSQTVKGTGRPVQHRAYAYRADGHLLEVTDQLDGSRNYDLDAAGRVTTVHAHDWNETYAYDSAGNQTSAGWPPLHPGHESTGSRSYAGTRITRAGNTRYEHDAQGRTVLRRKTRISHKPDTWHYYWDAEDRLASARTPDGTLWRYQYDPLGRRIAKQRLAPDGESVVEQVDFTWDGSTLCEQTTSGADLPNPVTLTWDHQGLHPISQSERITAPDASQDEIDTRFFAIVTDLVGTPSELVSESGDIAWRTRTTLWGTTTWNASASAYTPLRFPGQYFDPETGLHYNYFRHYDPEISRYASPDPLGLAPAPNPNAYVKNPHTQSDPLGLSPYPNEHLGNLPIHSRYDRFYVRAGELVDNRIASHPLTDAQMLGGDVVGHGGVRNLPNEDLTRFGGPQGNDPISGYRDWAPGDSPQFPGSQVHITGGHHRTAEVVRRIQAGEMDPDILIEFALRE